jgi:hypothetical protein
MWIACLTGRSNCGIVSASMKAKHVEIVRFGGHWYLA